MLKVFISHSSQDLWIADQIRAHIARCGASTFLDETDVQHGDDFDAEIVKAADESTELLVLLTPWSTQRPYIWLEMGLFWQKKRIVGVLHGISAKDISTDERIPSLLKKIDLVELNRIDTYFSQLAQRVKNGG